MPRLRTFLVGRDPSCDFHIADESVSRRHAEVVLAGDGRFFVTDRGSTRGTFVLAGQDWEPVRQAYVAATARIRFGGYDMPAARLAVLGGRAVDGSPDPERRVESAHGGGSVPARRVKEPVRNPETGEIVEGDPMIQIRAGAGVNGRGFSPARDGESG